MQKNSLNKVILIGRLGSKPEGRYTKQGKAIVQFSLATNEVWKNQQGEQVDHTEWHCLVAWDKLAEFCTEYLNKGQLISVEGTLRTRKWADKEETKLFKITEILCNNITILDNLSSNKG